MYENVAGQIEQGVADEPITDRLVSVFDPDVRPIRKGVPAITVFSPGLITRIPQGSGSA